MRKKGKKKNDVCGIVDVCTSTHFKIAFAHNLWSSNKPLCALNCEHIQYRTISATYALRIRGTLLTFDHWSHTYFLHFHFHFHFDRMHLIPLKQQLGFFPPPFRSYWPLASEKGITTTSDIQTKHFHHCARTPISIVLFVNCLRCKTLWIFYIWIDLSSNIDLYARLLVWPATPFPLFSLTRICQQGSRQRK